MANIESILAKLDWRLEWLNTLSPSDFSRAGMAIGMYPGMGDAASEVYRILVDHLRDGHPEEFIEGLKEFMSTMQVADSNRVVDLILVSIDRDLDQCEIRRIELADSLDGSTVADDDYPDLDYALMGIEESSDNRLDWFHLLPFADVDQDDPCWEPEVEPSTPVAKATPHYEIPDRTGVVKLFSGEDLGRVAHSGEMYRDEVATRRYAKVIDALVESGPYRNFGFLPEAIAGLAALAEELPNFGHVIDHIKESVNLALLCQVPLTITPILLLGDPGIGKSYFVKRVQEILGVPSHQLQFDNLQLGSVLAGAEPIWSTSQPGIVFEALISGSHISPIISLDEIDKAGHSYGHGDPLSPLHTLLEPETARHFGDACIPLPIDASHIFWIATANGLGRLDASLVSRFNVFTVPTPTPEERRLITSSIASTLIGAYAGIEIDEAVLDGVGELPPRIQRQMLTSSVARAKWLGCDRVSVEHLAEVLGRSRLGKHKGNGLGFQMAR